MHVSEEQWVYGHVNQLKSLPGFCLLNVLQPLFCTLLARTELIIMRLAWKLSQITLDTSKEHMYIKMRSEASEVWEIEGRDSQFYAIIGNCRFWIGQGCHSLKGPGRGMKSIPMGPTNHRTVGCIEPPGGTTNHRTVTGLLVVSSHQGAPPTTGLLVVSSHQGAPPTTGLLVVSSPPGGTTYHRTVGCIEPPGGTTYHRTVGCIEPPGEVKDHFEPTTLQTPLIQHAGWGVCVYYYQDPLWIPFLRKPPSKIMINLKWNPCQSGLYWRVCQQSYPYI